MVPALNSHESQMLDRLKSKRSNVRVKSKFSTEEVEFVDFIIPEHGKELGAKYKFYCPICLRYFTHILLTTCCDNYLCHLCTDDLKTQELKDQDFKALCPFGCHHTEGNTDKLKLRLTDVDPAAQIKRYSDSQYAPSLYEEPEQVDD